MRQHSTILLVTLVLLLAGCVTVAPEPQTSPVATATSALTASDLADLVSPVSTAQIEGVADPMKATLFGRVFSREDGGLHHLSGTVMWLAQVHWNTDKTDGAFVLSGTDSPTATIKEDSSFVFAAIPPGDYAIVVGDPMGMNAIVLEPDGKAKVITLAAGETVDLGNLEVQMTMQKR